MFVAVVLAELEATRKLASPPPLTVCTASAFPRLAPGTENTALAVLQHREPSAADSQQYAAGAAYPSSPPHSHTCTPALPKSYAVAFVAGERESWSRSHPTIPVSGQPPPPRPIYNVNSN